MLAFWWWNHADIKYEFILFIISLIRYSQRCEKTARSKDQPTLGTAKSRWYFGEVLVFYRTVNIGIDLGRWLKSNHRTSRLSLLNGGADRICRRCHDGFCTCPQIITHECTEGIFACLYNNSDTFLFKLL